MNKDRAENFTRLKGELEKAPVDLSYIQSIVDTVRESLLVLDSTLRIRSANRAFYRQFQVAPEQTEGALIYHVGNRAWDIEALRTLLEDILSHETAMSDFFMEHEFPTVGRKALLRLDLHEC